MESKALCLILIRRKSASPAPVDAEDWDESHTRKGDVRPGIAGFYGCSQAPASILDPSWCAIESATATVLVETTGEHGPTGKRNINMKRRSKDVRDQPVRRPPGAATSGCRAISGSRE